MKTRILMICLLAVIIFINAFIFANSFDNVEQSYEKSDVVTDVVGTVVSDEKEAGLGLSLSYLVRKFAHLIEFAMLGIAVAVELYLIKRVHSKRFYGVGCFYALAVAVLDEYIQAFSDRTDSIADVLLDFGGFLIGTFIAIIGIFVFLIVNKKRKIRQTETENDNA